MSDTLFKDSMILLGLKTTGAALVTDLLPMLRKGFPSESLERVAKELDLSTMATGESLGLAKRTVTRRLKKTERSLLTMEESERVFRLARALTEARHVFGNDVKARRWIRKPNRALGGASPLSMLDTDIGANAVFEELGRIEHGVFA